MTIIRPLEVRSSPAAALAAAAAASAADRPRSGGAASSSGHSLSGRSWASTTLSSGKFMRHAPAATLLIPAKSQLNAAAPAAAPAAGGRNPLPQFNQGIPTLGARAATSDAFEPANSFRPPPATPLPRSSGRSCVPESREQVDVLPRRPPSSRSTSSLFSRSQRAGSAMSGLDQNPLVAQASDPYMTVYKSEFHKRAAPEAPNVRPPTQLGMSDQPLRDETTYAAEYAKKHPNPNPSLWSGGNNPHPSQAFMVWKYPTNKQRQPDDEAPALTNEQYDLAMRGRCQSTYQTDYLGFPQGYRPPDGAAGGAAAAADVPYTLDSLQRYSYQQPSQSDALRIGTTRYSHSGADRHRQLVGGAPSISQVQLGVKHSTTYDRHFNETAPPTSRGPKFPEKSSRSAKGKDANTVAQLYAESRSDVENMDARYAEPAGAPAAMAATLDSVRQNSGRIPEPRWITTPVPAPLPS